MGYTLAIYTDEVYREIRLPMVDNMDYMVNLSAKDFLLHYGITLQLEVIDGIWHIKKNSWLSDMQSQCRICRRYLKAGSDSES